MPRMQLRELMQRQTEAFERQARAFERQAQTFERQTQAFERQAETFERQTQAFERQTHAFERLDGHMAQFGRRSDAMAAATIKLVHVTESLEAQSRATQGAIADLAGEIRALRESRS